MACEIHLNDIGTAFRVTVLDCNDLAIDVSSATSQQFVFLKPDGTKSTVNSSFYTDGTDGVLEYLSQSGDLDQLGKYKLQAIVTLPSGTWSSTIQSFKVYNNI